MTPAPSGCAPHLRADIDRYSLIDARQLGGGGGARRAQAASDTLFPGANQVADADRGVGACPKGRVEAKEGSSCDVYVMRFALAQLAQVRERIRSHNGYH